MYLATSLDAAVNGRLAYPSDSLHPNKGTFVLYGSVVIWSPVQSGCGRLNVNVVPSLVMGRTESLGGAAVLRGLRAPHAPGLAQGPAVLREPGCHRQVATTTAAAFHRGTETHWACGHVGV